MDCVTKNTVVVRQETHPIRVVAYTHVREPLQQASCAVDRRSPSDEGQLSGLAISNGYEYGLRNTAPAETRRPRRGAVRLADYLAPLLHEARKAP